MLSVVLASTLSFVTTAHAMDEAPVTILAH